MSDGLGDWGWGWLGQQVGGLPYNGKVKLYSPIAYWIMGEASGTTITDEIDSPNQDGTYTGVTLGQTGIGDGYNCPLWDGANDVGALYTATLNGNFDTDTGSMIIWLKVSGAGVWTDAATRIILRIEGNSQNYLSFSKTSTNNRMSWTHRYSNTTRSRNKDSVSTTGWIMIGASWDSSGDAFKAYYYTSGSGGQEGATLTGLGAWAGGALDSDHVNAGSYAAGTPSFVWDGYLAHLAIWDSVLSSSVFDDLAVL